MSAVENRGQSISVKNGQAFERTIGECLEGRGFSEQVPFTHYYGGKAKADFGKGNILIEAKSIGFDKVESRNRGNQANQVLAVREDALRLPDKRFILVLNDNVFGWNGVDKYIMENTIANLTVVIFKSKQQLLDEFKEKGIE